MAFGDNGEKVNGKLSALDVRGTLVVKLPKARVDALVAAEERAPGAEAGGTRVRGGKKTEQTNRRQATGDRRPETFRRGSEPAPIRWTGCLRQL